jgi:hypothetical protein
MAKEASGLAEDQLQHLNAEFYGGRNGPSEYFHTRLLALAVIVGGGERVAAILDDGIAFEGIVVKAPAEGWDHEDPDREHVAIDSENLFHHAAECLFRMLLAHRDQPACPWLELGRLRRDLQFRKRIENEVLIDDDVWRSVVVDVLFRGDDPATRIGPDDPDEWDAVVDTTLKLLDLVKEQFLADVDLYNCTKHGLAVLPSAHQFSVFGDDGPDQAVTLGDGMAIAHLERREDDDGLLYWRHEINWLNTRRTLSLTWWLLMPLHNLWLVARARYTGVSDGTAQYATPEMLELLLESTRPAHPARSFSARLPYYESP